MNYFKINQIVLELERFARKLNLTDGILHAQIIANQLDFFIIELTRRCSGDLYPVPVEMVTNVPWSKVILKSFMGKKVKAYEIKNSIIIRIVVTYYFLLALLPLVV